MPTQCAQDLGNGSPTWEFNFSTLREFVELALGTRQVQCKTTSDLGFMSNAQALRFIPAWRVPALERFVP
jgi:hypothetical protein